MSDIHSGWFRQFKKEWLIESQKFNEYYKRTKKDILIVSDHSKLNGK